MKNTRLIPFLLFLLMACSSEPTPELIINIKDIAGKSVPEVESVLGKASNISDFKQHPCEHGSCEKASFQEDKYEIIFAKGKANRITIYNTPDLSGNKNALAALGLQSAKPDFYNPNKVVRWKYQDGLDEVSFFPDYILIEGNRLEFLSKK
jgi:hypothetical protein